MSHRQYNCEVCSASCTFEAMQMCTEEYEDCPVIQDLKDGIMTDRRPDDYNPDFPTVFTYLKPEYAPKPFDGEQ